MVELHRPWPDLLEGPFVADRDVTWLSSKEAARRLGVSTPTLYRLIDEGQIPAYRVGRVIRVQEQDLDAFIEGARVQPGELGHLYGAD